MAQPPAPLTSLEVMQRMTVEPQCWGGWGGGDVSHPLQLTTGLVINSSVKTSPTLAGERMLLIPKVSIMRNVFCLKQNSILLFFSDCYKAISKGFVSVEGL